MHTSTRGRLRRTLTAMVLGGLALSLAGCIVIGTGGERKTPPTVGQQLVDLKEARDRGAISEQEYNTAREKILCGVGR